MKVCVIAKLRLSENKRESLCYINVRVHDIQGL